MQSDALVISRYLHFCSLFEILIEYYARQYF